MRQVSSCREKSPIIFVEQDVFQLALIPPDVIEDEEEVPPRFEIIGKKAVAVSTRDPLMYATLARNSLA